MVFPHSPPRNSPQDVRRVLKHLRNLVEDTELTRAEIEFRAGLSAGYLGRLLRGRVDLKLRHILALLTVLAIPPSRFWNSVFPDRRSPLPHLPYGRQQAPAAQLGEQQDLVRLYGFGIESVEGLRRRLESCERELVELLESGLAEESRRRGE